MIKRIELTNFMSHDHTVIEPAAGLTVLVGPNNCGKSAIVAALQIICSNENSTYVMRHGARECSVEVETDDGHVVQWRRKNSPSYVIDGQTFDRLRGSGLPDELHAALRMAKVDAGDNTDFDVHFGTQKSPIFLVGGSAANAARFFASSSDAIRLVEMQKRHKEKLTSAKSMKNRLEAEANQVNATLGILEPVVDLEKRLEASRDVYEALGRLANMISAAEKSEVALRIQSATIAGHSAQADALRSLSRPPEIAPTRPLHDALTVLQTAQREATAAESRAGALAKLSGPPELAPVGPLQSLIEALVNAKARLQTTASRAQALRLLAVPPRLTPTEPLQTLIRATVSEQARRETVASQSRVLSALLSPPALRDDSTIERLLSGIVRFNQHCRRAAAETRTLSSMSLPPQLADVEPLRRLVGRLTQFADGLATRARTSRLLGCLREPPQLVDESNLAASLAAINRAYRQVARCEQLSSAAALIAPAPAVFETVAISACVGRLEASAADVAMRESALRTAASHLAEAAADLRSKVEGSFCPICGSTMDAEKVIARATVGLGGHDHG